MYIYIYVYIYKLIASENQFQSLCDERSMFHHNARTQMNIVSKAASEVVRL